VRCATKMNFLLFVAFRSFSEVFPRDNFSKRVGGEARLKCYMQRKGVKFELVRDKEDTKKCYTQRK